MDAHILGRNIYSMHFWLSSIPRAAAWSGIQLIKTNQSCLRCSSLTPLQNCGWNWGWNDLNMHFPGWSTSLLKTLIRCCCSWSEAEIRTSFTWISKNTEQTCLLEMLLTDFLKSWQQYKILSHSVVYFFPCHGLCKPINSASTTNELQGEDW